MEITGTVGLSLREAALAAEEELSLTEDDPSPVSDESLMQELVELEQPAVESLDEGGVFDSLLQDNVTDDEQPAGDSFEVTVRGETFKVSLDELRNGYMRHSDYTRGKQEIADREREAERALSIVRLLEERPVETIRKLYQQISRGESLTVEGTPVKDVQAEVAKPTDIEELVEARVKSILESDPRLKAIEQEKQFAEVEQIFSEIEGMYEVSLTNDDKQLVLEKAIEMGTTDLKFVFGGLMHKAQQAKLAKANVKRAATAKPQSVDPAALAPVTPKRYADFKSALRDSLAEEQGPQIVSNL